MSGYQFDFNMEDVPDSQFDDLPPGTYKAMIIDAVLKDVKPPKVGRYLELAFEVLDGDLAGRKFWERLNLDNPNQEAVNIAQRTSKSIAMAGGFFPARTSDDYLDKVMLVTITYKPSRRDPQQMDQRRAYAAVNGVAAPAGAPRNEAPRPAGNKPWERRA